MSRSPTAAASVGRVERVLVVAADEHERLPRLRDPGELGAEAGAARGDAHGARDVRLVELQLGAHVDDQRAVRAGLVDLARGERVRVDALDHERAAVERDDRAEVRRLGTERGRRRGDELVAVPDLQERLACALEADRRGDLQVHARAAAERAAEVAGPHLARLGEVQQRVVERAEDVARALRLVHGEIRAGDVADEQRVAGQDGPRLVAAGRVGEREGRVLGPVPGRVQRADDERAERELPAVVERLVLVVGLGEAVHVDGRPGGGHEPAVARDVVGVVVGLEHVLDPHAEVAGEAQVVVDVELGIDDRGHAGVLIADEVAGAAEVVVRELAEEHPGREPTPPPRRASGLRSRRRSRRCRAPAPTRSARSTCRRVRRGPGRRPRAGRTRARRRRPSARAGRPSGRGRGRRSRRS